MTDYFTVEKDSSANLDYKYDWASRKNGNSEPGVTDWLDTANGEIITDFSVVSTPIDAGSPLVITGSYLSDANTSVTVWVDGGTPFRKYLLTCHILTSSSPVFREDDRSILLKVVNR